MHNVYDHNAFSAWPWIEFLATWWLQASILLAIGLLTAWALRRPAYQSTVFRASLTAALLCPLLAVAVNWSGMAVLTLDLRQRFDPPASAPSATTIGSTVSALPAAPSDDGLDSRTQMPLDSSVSPLESGNSSPATAANLPSPTTEDTHSVPVAAIVAHSTDSIANASARSLLGYSWLVVAVWALGAVGFGIHLLLDLRRARWLIKQSCSADESSIHCCRQLAGRFGTPKPTVLVNPLLSSPCLIGQWHPVILLPEETQPSHRERVFLHELAHLKRGDWAWAIVGRIACALLWFQPLVWWLHRSHLSVAEDICDDYVIEHDGNREDYLQQLIEIAEQSLPGVLPAALSLVGFRSKLGKRAMRILDTTRSLSTHVSQRFLIVALMTAVVALSSVAMLEIGQSKATLATEPAQASADPATQDNSSASSPTSDKDGKQAPRTYAGKVVDSQGKAIAGAKVTAINDSLSLKQRQQRVLTETMTDGSGHYSLTFTAEDGFNDVRVTAQGYGECFENSDKLEESFTKGKSQLDFQLRSEQPVVGRVVDTEGNAMPGVKLQILRVVLPTSDEAAAKWSSQSHPELLKGREMGMMQDARATATAFPRRANRSFAADKAPSVITDNTGRYRIEGYGGNTLLHVRLSGPSIAVQEVQLVARTMQVVYAFEHWVRNSDYRHYGNDSTLVVSPMQRIGGRVVDKATQKPLASVPVVITRLGTSTWADDSVQSITDQDGRFELAGAPLGGGHVIEVQPAADQPYFATHIELPKGNETEALNCDFQLNQCQWIRGKVTDDQGVPVIAKLNLHPFRDNPHLSDYPNFDPQITGHTPDYGTKTNERGEFRIKAIAGHSVVTAFTADYNLSPLYFPNRPEGLLEKVGGESMSKVINPFSADFFDAMVEVDIKAEEQESVQDLVVKKGIERELKLVDLQGRTLEAVDILGQTWMRALQPDAKLQKSAIKIAGLGPDESRVVVVLAPDGQSGKHLDISGNESTAIVAQLERCSLLRGRVLDSDAQPVKELNIRVSVENTQVRDNWARELKPAMTNERGEFSTRVPPGGTYTISAYSAAGPNFFVKLKPNTGDDYDLGDLTAGVERVVEDPNEYRVPVATVETKVQAVETQVDRTPKNETFHKPGTSVSGTVVDAQGANIAGADVAVIAGKKSGQFFIGESEVLAVGVTNEQGRFELPPYSATSQTHGAVRLVVRSKGTALQALPVELELGNQDVGSIRLSPHSLIRVKLVDLEGKPAANIGVDVQCVMASKESGGKFTTEYQRLSDPPPAWIGPLTTDDQGLLTIPGVGKDLGVALRVRASDKFAIQGIALNTGWKEDRAANDATYRDIVKNLKADEVAVIPLAPARIFEGTVRLGKNGPPAANTKVSIWASQQELFGSMISIEGMTDAQGHYRLIPYPGIRFGISAYPPEDQPFTISKVENLKWDETKSTLVTDIDLPECILSRGQVVDGTTGQPISGASVQYWPMQSNPNDRENIVTGWQGIKRTNAKGEFAIPVLAGDGWLIVQALGTSYAIQTSSERQLAQGKAAGGRRAYAHAFQKLEIPAGTQPKPLRIELQPGQDVTLEVVDADGKPVDDAQVFSRLTLSEDLVVGWRSFLAPKTRSGQVTLRGIHEDGDIPVYILDAKRKLGATVLVNRQMKSAKVRLEPCGSADIYLCDEEGTRKAGLELLLSMVVTQGSSFTGMRPDPTEFHADEDFLPNVDRTNHSEDLSNGDGKLTLSALIPGATYRYLDYRGQTHDFIPKSGQTIHLGELTRKIPDKQKPGVE